jgi:hypothetical protein
MCAFTYVLGGEGGGARGRGRGEIPDRHSARVAVFGRFAYRDISSVFMLNH